MKPNVEQQEALNAIRDGRNAFITGRGGTGKSFIINEICKMNPDRTILVAPTGIAALNIGGATAHKTFGLPITICTKDDWQPDDGFIEMFNCFDDHVDTIIIDEISMLRADGFITIDRKLKRARPTKANLPFGGIQVIIVGDFYQLPPVLVNDEIDAFYDMYPSVYAFGTKVWKQLDLVYIHLTKNERTPDPNTDRAFNSIRLGKTIPNVLKWINKQCESNEENISEDAVTLCTRNSDAEEINDIFYSRIKSQEFTNMAELTGEFNDRPVKYDLKLKVGCRVVICANNSWEDYSNGQSGHIDHIKFTYDDDAYIRVILENGSAVYVKPHTWESYKYTVEDGELSKRVVGTFTQFPIKLGYGITIHKSQGLTLDECILDLGRGSFAHGQTYTGLSRIRSISKMALERPIEPNDVIVDDEVIDFYNSIGF